MDEETALRRNRETSRDAVEDLLTRIYGIPGRRKIRARLIPVLSIAAYVVILILLDRAGVLESGWPALAAFALTCGVAGRVWTLAERHEMRAVEALAACREPRALGGLLDSANYGNRRVKAAVQSALVELLPRLTPDSPVLVGVGRRESLNALLYGKSGDLALAALAAIEQVGDGTALPYLTSIAAGKGVPGALRGQRDNVQERARHAVDVINARIEAHNRAGTLLRASQMPTAAPDQLVRPAQEPSVVNGRELLRPQISAEQDAVHRERIHEEDNIV